MNPMTPEHDAEYWKSQFQQAQQELDQLKAKIANSESVNLHTLNSMKHVIQGSYEVGMVPRTRYVFFPVN